MIRQNSLLQHQFQYCIDEKNIYQIFDFFLLPVHKPIDSKN